jgi:autophagy-related protein 13
MVLETWSLGVFPQHTDHTVQLAFTIYNRMGILLKSLLSVSRITPAYKLSRRQGPDSYRICYRIYMGEPQLHSLGILIHYFDNLIFYIF